VIRDYWSSVSSSAMIGTSRFAEPKSLTERCAIAGRRAEGRHRDDAASRGFKMELAAAEPNVVSPVAMAFDEDGRLYVVEMIDYSSGATKNLGESGSWKTPTATASSTNRRSFADGCPGPRAVFPWKGGVFVGLHAGHLISQRY